MVDSSTQLSVIRSKYYWKVAVKRCTCYLGQYSITREFLCEKGAKEWESNLKSSLRILFLSRIFDFDGLFYRMDTVQSRLLAISTITKPPFKVHVVSNVGSLLRILQQLKSVQVLHLFSKGNSCIPRQIRRTFRRRHQVGVSCQSPQLRYRPGSPRSANLMHVNIVIPMVIRKFVHYIISFRAGGNVYWFHRFRTNGNSPAALVLAGPVFLKVKKQNSIFTKSRQ